MTASLGFAASGNASPDWQARDWAMACMTCHNASAPVSAGKATLSVLEGRPAAALMDSLRSMRDGKRLATLMPQLLKGYREDELQRIAAYFAAQPKPSPSSPSSR
ncbi:c-type cytochrome [Pandoraea oxalativorans]|uniref:c-type cytochrome n=1 Tax=Pandoraea oxalativorans TaxID=573737 RepID=UPI0012F51F0F|nr:cytochrome C [Pandoraea oxalativorans]